MKGASDEKVDLGSHAATALIAAPALAADLGRAPVRPVVAPVPLFTWTGFYIGGHVGGGFGNKDWEFVNVGGIPLAPPFPATSHDVSGLLAGGQVGFN